MRDLLQKIDLNAARWCVHFPPLCDYELIVNEFSSLCQNACQSIAVARLPEPQSIRFSLKRCQSTIDWFCAATSTSQQTARQIIEGIPVSVLRDLQSNATNPRRFLGLAAAITKQTDVLLYDSSGMDPFGRTKIHRYAREHFKGTCLLHVCWVPLSSSCPNTPNCVAVTPVSKIAK